MTSSDCLMPKAKDTNTMWKLLTIQEHTPKGTLRSLSNPSLLCLQKVNLVASTKDCHTNGSVPIRQIMETVLARIIWLLCFYKTSK